MKSQITNHKSQILDSRGQALRLGSGQALLLSVVIVFVVLMFGAVGFGLLVTTRLRVAQQATTSERAFLVAEAGIEDAMRRIRGQMNVPANYTLAVGSDGLATITVASPVPTTRTITSLGTIGTIQRRLQVSMMVNNQGVDFRYGVHVGEGGLEMENNSRVQGSVYSNGSILALGSGNGGSQCALKACIDGDAYASEWDPQALNQSWEGFSSWYTFASSNPTIDPSQRFVTSKTDGVFSVWVNVNRVGSPDDITVRIVTDNGGMPSKTELVNATLAASLIPQVASCGSSSNAWREIPLGSSAIVQKDVPYWLILDARRSSSDYYCWASDSGNGYLSGFGMYSEDWNAGNPVWTDAGRDFQFRVWLGGATTQIDTVAVGGTARAPLIRSSVVSVGEAEVRFEGGTASTITAGTIQDCTASVANYVTNVGCTCSSCNVIATPPDAPDKIPLPITQSMIDAWKVDAWTSGGTIGTVSPGNNENITLGPVKINGDLLLANNNILTVRGTIWVTGNIDISNGSSIQLSSGYGSLSGLVLSDGWIHTQNNGEFRGSGQAGSYLMLLSLVACDGISGTNCTHHTSAIDLHNNATGVIFYAYAGQIYLHNGVQVSELSGFRIHLSQNTLLAYDAGLANAQFSAGPAGGWTVQSWQEVP